jgi:hypothetical protein
MESDPRFLCGVPCCLRFPAGKIIAKLHMQVTDRRDIIRLSESPFYRVRTVVAEIRENVGIHRGGPPDPRRGPERPANEDGKTIEIQRAIGSDDDVKTLKHQRRQRRRSSIRA